MRIEVEPFGDVDGEVAHRATLTSGAMKAVFCDYGARLLELWVPDRNGNLADVVLADGDIAALSRAAALRRNTSRTRRTSRISRQRVSTPEPSTSTG